ncbi:MAG: type II toxin-antitoxin system RelE/ParE family toxin [Spirochaetaceae bacterium]|nr:MAG: type II toxin-antitoxin system RelE/ParE family toxin [Spirochaetaceae bacterium]
MTRISWSTIAAQDLDDIVSWILDNHSVQHAESFVNIVDASVQQLSQQPESGRVIPELERQNITKYRELVLPPWRLFYTIDGDRVLIHAVIDGRRSIEDILLRRNIR